VTYTWHADGGRMVELCDECGFDARELAGSDDEQRRLDAAYAELERLSARPEAGRRPAPEVWSAREYADHCVEVGEVILGWVDDLAAAGVRPEFGDLGAGRRAVAALLPRLTDDGRAAVLPDEYAQPVTAEWLIRHLLHDAEHHVLDVRRNYAALARAELPEVPFRR
jgi:hypothetical protein